MRVFSDPEKPSKVNKSHLPFEPDDNKFDPPPPHLRASDYVKYGYVSKELFDTYFKFAFVRNPWDRIVSEYKYRRHSHRYPFKKFLFKRFPQPSWSDHYCHVIPQYDFLHDSDGNILVDFVGRFESLQDDFGYVCKKLNISIEALPHVNQSSSIFNRRGNNFIETLRSIKSHLSPARRKNTFSSYVEYYDDESKEFVASIYRKDIETFGYKFED
jgi:hypothetical protein